MFFALALAAANADDEEEEEEADADTVTVVAAAATASRLRNCSTLAANSATAEDNQFCSRSGAAANGEKRPNSEDGIYTPKLPVFG